MVTKSFGTTVVSEPTSAAKDLTAAVPAPAPVAAPAPATSAPAPPPVTANTLAAVSHAQTMHFATRELADQWIGMLAPEQQERIQNSRALTARAQEAAPAPSPFEIRPAQPFFMTREMANQAVAAMSPEDRARLFSARAEREATFAASLRAAGILSN